MPSSTTSRARCCLTGDRMLTPGVVSPGGAQPQVDIGFAGTPGSRTYLERQRVAYPFHLCRALYLPGDPVEFCTVYLQSCSGGIFQADRLGLRVTVREHARAHLTSAASTVVHTMNEGHAEQTVHIDTAPGAFVEYLPDPMILFPRTRLHNHVTVRLDPDATAVLCDSFLAHDPGGHQSPFDWFVNETRVESPDGRLLALDRFRVEGADVHAGQVGIHGPYAMQATLMVLHPAAPDAMLESLRSVLPGAGSVYAGVSLLPGGCGAWMRAMSSDAVALRALVRQGWAAVRTRLTGQAPGTRRK